jgi:G protein-coupled receptor GPR1
MWLVPFVVNVLQYDDKFATSLPFGLTCLSTIFVCSQAAVDCWLFSTREKPWKSISGNDGNFGGSLKFWSGWKGVSKRKVVHGPGKTRDEMIREARVAYRRRDEELAQRRMESGLGSPVESGARRGKREWWENSADPEMSPVAEEVSNPVKDIVMSEDSKSDEDATLTNVKTRSSQNTDGVQQHLTFATPKKENVHST